MMLFIGKQRSVVVRDIIGVYFLLRLPLQGSGLMCSCMTRSEMING